MKKVLVIITTAMVPYGGLTSVMMNLYRNIDKEMFQIDFASTNSNIDESLRQELQANDSKYYALGNRKKELPRYIKKLSKVIRDGKYDVVHVNSNSATALIELSIAKRYGVKKRIVHNHNSTCDHKIIHLLCEPQFKKTYTDAIACSQKAGDWIFGEGKYVILNNGIDTAKYSFSQEKRETVRSRYHIPQSAIVIGHVGKINKQKNHKFLIEVFDTYHKQNTESMLLLVGDGNMRGTIEKSVCNRGVSKHVISVGMQNETQDFLSAMDVFCFPSLWEGMPLSLIEAQANGLPCLVSDRIDRAANLTEKVKNISIDNGTKEWVEAIEKYCADTDRICESGKNIVKICQSGFDAKANAKELASLYLK